MYFNADLILVWRCYLMLNLNLFDLIFENESKHILDGWQESCHYASMIYIVINYSPIWEWFGNVRHISVWKLSLMMVWNLKLSFLFIVRSDFLRISAHCRSAMEAENGCCQATEPHSCCFSNVRSQYYWANGVESLALLENSPGLLFSQMAFSWLNFHVCWLKP